MERREPACGPGRQRCRGSVSIASAICSDSDSKMGNTGKLGPGPLFPNPWPQLFLHRLLGSCPETLTLPGSSLALPPPTTPLPVNADGPEGRHRSPRSGGRCSCYLLRPRGGQAVSSELSVHPIISYSGDHHGAVIIIAACLQGRGELRLRDLELLKGSLSVLWNQDLSLGLAGCSLCS